MNIDLKILDAIKQKDLISVRDYDRLKNLIKTGEELKNIISDEHIIKEADYLSIKSELLGVSFVNLSGRKIDKKVLELVPVDVARNYYIIAFEAADGELRVGMTNPRSFQAVEAVDFIAKREGLRPKHYLISDQDFKNALSEYETASGGIEKMIDVAKEKFIEPQRDLERIISGEETTETEMGVIKRAPVSKIVSVIITHAVEGGASDVHIEPLVNSCRVRYRIDGVLHTTLILPKYLHAAIVSRIKVLARLKIDETRRPQDGRIRLKINNKEIDFRISVLPLYDEEKVVMRILNIEQGAFTLEGVGFTDKQLKIIEESLSKPTGMILVTGPTGSGKSTSISAMMSKLNKEGVNIVTLEDPVEYYIEGLSQAQVRPEVGFTFATGLRSIFRQDPNIIMVGEIRDDETAELAIHAGLTGHLVFSTLHTNDSTGAIPRLIDMKVEPFLMASTLNIIIAQRLVKRICLHCKEKEELLPDIKEKLFQELAVIEPEVEAMGIKLNAAIEFYKGEGCAYCGGTGYKGRIAIAEILHITPRLKEIIMSGCKTDAMREELKSQHFIALRQDGFIKVLMGITTLEEVIRVTRE